MLNSSLTQLRRRIPGGRPFHLLLASLAVSSCGDWLYNVALLALVYERTGSASWVAMTTAARIVPIVVLGPLGGVFADRYDRWTLMIASDLTRAGLMLALGIVAAAGLPIVLAPAIAGLATAAGTVQPPCVAACTARFVAEAELQRASALRAAVGQGAIVAGPALGAVILLIGGPTIAILINEVTFVLSAFAIWAISAPAHPAFAPGRGGDAELPSILADVRAGARALRGAPAAIRLFAADVLCSAVYGVLTVTLVLVGHRAGAGAGGYGLLLGAFGAGGLVGAGLTARFDAPRRWRRMLAIALTCVGVVLVALGAVSGLGAAMVLALVGGGGMIVGEVLSETALPRMLDDDVLARAYGLALPASLGGIVAGSLLAGPLVSLLGLQLALASTGLFVLLAAALLLRRPLDIVGLSATPALAAPSA